MFALIIVIHYYMVYLTTVPIDYKNNEQCCAYFFLNFLNFITSEMYWWTFIAFLSANDALNLTYYADYKTTPQYLSIAH